MTISKSKCCEKTLEILLKNAKFVEDLDLIESTIEDYQEEFKVNLIKYKKEVRNIREKYLSRGGI